MRQELTKNSWYEHDSYTDIGFEFETLWNMKPECSDTIKIFGKEIPIPRLQRVYGIDYTFSGKTHKSIPIPKIFESMIQYFNNKYNRNYNMLLINWYRDGSDYISMHSDKEKQIKEHSEIITLSLGDTRMFVLENKQTKEKVKINVSNSEFITMGGHCQDEYKHGISKTKKKVGPRISITLREFI